MVERGSQRRDDYGRVERLMPTQRRPATKCQRRVDYGGALPSEGPSTISVVQDYAGAVRAERGRCFRFVTHPDGKPVHCPDRPISSGWLKTGDQWHEVEACDRHSAKLRFRGPMSARRTPEPGVHGRV
jgi:hypothetical protein